MTVMTALAFAAGAILLWLSVQSLVAFILFPRDYFGWLVLAIILGISGVVVFRAAVQTV